MNPPLSALVLAAGLGTRLLPYSAKVPKPLVPIVDRSLLEHQFAAVRALSANFPLGRMLVNAHHLADQVVVASQQLGADFVFVEQELLGTGGPLQQVFAQGIHEELLVLNGDCFHDFHLADFIKQARASNADFALLCLPFGPKNLSCNSNGFICGRDEKYLVDTPAQKVAFSGISWYSSNALARLRKEDFNVVDFWAREAEEGRLPFAYIAASKHHWIDMGTPQGFFDASQIRLQELGIDRWSASPDVALQACIGKGCIVHQNVQIANTVQLENCIVLPGAKIHGEAMIRNQIIGEDFVWEVHS